MNMLNRLSAHLCILAIAVIIAPALTGAASPPANEHFQRVWERTERPVIDAAESRTWIWGPFARTGAMSEPYVESPGGFREVQYFDKTRMEINEPESDPESIWYVTNGLLAKELITGRVQVGHLMHLDSEPPAIPVAGDLHPDTPTYRTLSQILNAEARELGTIIIERLESINSEADVSEDPALGLYEVEAAYYVPETGNTVASPFWEFMNSTGLIRVGPQNVPGRLFEDPFFATGLPITEAYWVHVPVETTWQDVLLQCFERRCLTYTPDNPAGWQVEAGNIGLHYHQFRYGMPPVVLDCVDLNVAIWEDLQLIRNIGASRATAILELRPLSSLDDLLEISGIGPSTLEQIIEEGIACLEYHPETGNVRHHSM